MARNDTQVYQNPLVTRNASPAMCRLFSPQVRIETWRRLWLALAEAQRQQGLPISDKQLRLLRRTLGDIDFAAAARYEKQFRHDVMAHLHAWGDAAPEARGILHLGATSCYVGDNADLILMRDGLGLIRDWLVNVIDALGRFATRHRSVPTLGFTHYQPAQLTTVGKRATLWAWSFVQDLDEITHRIGEMKFRGLKGTTGTQESYLKLFDGDGRKVDRLEALVARKMGFDAVEPVTGQTASRKTDAAVVAALAQVAASVHKVCNDLRLLANLKEIEEPFERTQVGSTAMAYKRNPMRCERATGLARWVLSLLSSPFQTAAEQWLERTLDDSSNKRLSVPEAFLATDGMLRIMTNVCRGLVVYPRVIRARVMAELPFMATEEILMAAVRRGGDRQALHERIRVHAQAAAAEVKQHGRPNDLIDRLRSDDAFAGVEFKAIVDPRRFVGRAPEQTARFVREHITPLRRKHRRALGLDAELNV